MHVIHIIVCFIYLKICESGIYVAGMSTVWEDTGDCTNQRRCSLFIYLMNMFSYSFGIIMDRAINSPFHGKNVVGGLNATNKSYLE